MSMRKEIKRFTSNNGNAYAIVSESLVSGKADVMVVTKQESWSDWPIQYYDDTIAYDNPYMIPKYAKELTKKAFKYIKDNYPVRYTISHTLNLPDQSQFFITCDRADMQPNLCNSAIAPNFWETISLIGNHAAKLGYTSIEIEFPKRRFGY